MKRQIRWLASPVGVGAAPSIIKKWFPEITNAEWDNPQKGSPTEDDAYRDGFLKQANFVEAQWNGKIGEMRFAGACDATKPGLLAGAMREHLLASGGKLADMDDLGDKSFGPKDCQEWLRVFGKAPDQDTVAKAIGLATGGTSPWVKNSNGHTLQITLGAVCPSGFKLPTCVKTTGPGPTPPECSATNPCPPGQECISGTCVTKTTPATTKSSSGLGLLILGGAAALGAIFLGPAIFGKGGASGAYERVPKQEELLENRRRSRRRRRY